MATTPVYALPYPVGTDRVMDGDDVIRALAERVEALLLPRDAVPSGRRNVIRNGDAGVHQRSGAASFTTNNVYTADGWRMLVTGGTMTVTRTTRALGTGAKHGMRSVVAGQAASTDLAAFALPIESVHTLAGQTVTLSLLASATSGTPSIGISVRQVFGTGGSPSATVLTSMGAVALSTTEGRKTLTFTVPSIAGKTLGTNADDYLEIRLWLSAGTSNSAGAGGIAIQNATIDITDVQLEAGSLATPFERLPIADQVAWCQRYLVRLVGDVAGRQQGFGVQTSTTAASVFVTFPVEMRAIPTFAQTGAWVISDVVALISTSSLSMSAGSSSARQAMVTAVTSGGTAFRVANLYSNAAGVYLDFSAELP